MKNSYSKASLSNQNKNPVSSSTSRLNLERKINKVMLQTPSNPNTSLSSYTSQKILNLQRFLDNVDSNSNSICQSIGGAPLQESIFLDQILKESQELNETQNVNLLKIEVSEAQKTIDSLKSLLETEQAKYKELEKKSQLELETKLEAQKTELEAIINRHLGFIDQLINDKTQLNNEIEGLLKKIKGFEENHDKAMNEMKENHSRELRTQKDQILAGEKLKKEKWMNEKLQEIKTMTIKGLEPELESLMAKHKKDLKKLEDQQEKEVKTIKASLQDTYEKDLLEMRKRLILEYEESYQKNRDVEFIKLKEAYKRLELQSIDEKDIMKKNHYKDIEQMEKGRKDQMEEYLNNLKKSQENHLEELKKAKLGYQEIIDHMKLELQKEKDDYQKKVISEQEIWKTSTIQSLQAEFDKKAIELEKNLQKDRDQQIELIISRLSEESADLEKKAFEKYQRKLSDVSGSKTNEFSNLQRKAKVLEEKKENLKTQVSLLETEKKSLESELESFKTMVVGKDKEMGLLLGELQKLKSQNSISDEIIESLEKNFNKRMEKERENHERRLGDLRKEIDESKAEHYKEIVALEEKQGKELENMEERIRKVIQRKENEIVRLGEEVKLKGMEIDKYKELLDKQRRDLMKN